MDVRKPTVGLINQLAYKKRIDHQMLPTKTCNVQFWYQAWTLLSWLMLYVWRQVTTNSYKFHFPKADIHYVVSRVLIWPRRTIWYLLENRLGLVRTMRLVQKPISLRFLVCTPRWDSTFFTCTCQACFPSAVTTLRISDPGFATSRSYRRSPIENMSNETPPHDPLNCIH